MAVADTQRSGQIWKYLFFGSVGVNALLFLFTSEKPGGDVEASAQIPQAAVQTTGPLTAESSRASPATTGGTRASRFLIPGFPIRGPVEWKDVKPELKHMYLLNSTIGLSDWYFNDYDWSKWQVNASAVVPVFTKDVLERNIAEAKSHGTSLGGYMPTGPRDLYAALDKYPIKGKSVLIIGTQIPWIEAIALAYEAGSITTVDFNKVVFELPPFRSMSIPELDATDETWDAVFSFSSLEHDGLGRYGDPLHPFGDIERMDKIKGLLKPGGLFYLAVPIGKDHLYWNAHRQYGRQRFPMLTQGWKVLGNFSEGLYPDHVYDTMQDIQPLFVLSL